MEGETRLQGGEAGLSQPGGGERRVRRAAIVGCKSAVAFPPVRSFVRCQGYIKAKNYPASTGVEVMCEGGESAMFKHLFKEWRDKNQTQGLGATHGVGKIGNVDQRDKRENRQPK